MPAFEITIGMNGRIWLKTTSIKQSIFLVDAISQYAQVSDSQTDQFIENILQHFDKFLEDK